MPKPAVLIRHPQCASVLSTLWGWSLVLLSLALSSFAHALNPDTIAKVKPAIVGVGTYNKLDTPRSTLLGTGFVVGKDLIATNDHVVPESLKKTGTSFVVFLTGEQKNRTLVATVVARDTKHDLALLHVNNLKISPMTLSNHTVREGEMYLYTGFPIGTILGLHPVTHRGMVSSITPIAIPVRTSKELTLSQLKQLKQPYSVYQLDGVAYPGNSGSPVYEVESGKVIAVINKVLVKKTRESALTDPSAITYAIPVKHLKALMSSISR